MYDRVNAALTYVAYADIIEIHQMSQSGNDTLNAVQLLFARKFVPEMSEFSRCCQTYG